MNQKYEDPRPSIPAELRRQILLETGHGCAVTLCQNDMLNIHHIDGNRENNSPDNLIALCSVHHDRAHDTGRARLTRQDLLAYKRKLSKSNSGSFSSNFVLADESRRVAAFRERVREALSWHDGEHVRSIDNQLGYWFPIDLYNSMLELLADRHSYDVEMRSFDPEAMAHQDAIMVLIQALVDEVSKKSYARIGYCYNYRPGSKGSPDYDEKVHEQMAHVNRISAEIARHMVDLGNYVTRR